MLTSLLRTVVRTGRLTVAFEGGRSVAFGPGEAGAPDVAVCLRDRATPVRLALDPDLALGEAYMDGRLVIERGRLEDLLELIGRNLENRPEPSRIEAIWTRRRNRVASAQAKKASARNVAHHYDLTDAFYESFLDPDLHYSCAYFDPADASLEAAQQAKVRHIIAKLDLKPGQRVLDIGSGWGGLALAIAKAEDVRVTGLTLSRPQLERARRRAADQGLSDRVAFERLDYRDAPGGFDRVVSVGMFEHVGPRHYEGFFEVVHRVLKPQGVALIHSIGARCGGGSNPWVRKYIFPGGYIPTLSETVQAIERMRFWVCDVEALRLHYALTLEHWLARFRAGWASGAAPYDERFYRMWEFYLAGCAMAFRHGDLMVMQIQLAKQIDALPIMRGYMERAERKLATGFPVQLAAMEAVV